MEELGSVSLPRRELYFPGGETARARALRGALRPALVLGAALAACGLLLAVHLSEAGAEAARGAAAFAARHSRGVEVVALREAHADDEAEDHQHPKSPNFAIAEVGWKVKVESQTGHKRDTTVIERDEQKRNFKIHYDGFPDAYDEWVPMDSTRLIEFLPTTTSTTSTKTETTSTSSTLTTTSLTITTSTSSSTTTPRKYVSLFCFTMARTDNYEIELIRLQLAKVIGVFDCDEQIVFSDRETWISAGPTFLKGKDEPIMISTFNVKANLTDAAVGGESGARQAAWLNAGDYVKCWQQVVFDGRFRFHEWTVKVDPDTVFLPGRLRGRLMNRPQSANPAVFLKTCRTTPRKCINILTVSRQYGDPIELQVVGASTDTFAVSSTCSTTSEAGQRCINNNWGRGIHVIVNQNGKFIAEASCCSEANEVQSLTHKCAQQQFESKDPGMSGALEVVSTEAVQRYSDNGHRCKADAYLDMGEDFFMQECFKLLGCEGSSGEQLLQDEFCEGEPGECKGSEVAFHPVKSPEKQIECYANAFMNLKVPELHSDLLALSSADG